MNIPIIAIDGPSASGKGTIARKLAKHYGFHYLNSGAIYRLIAYTAHQAGISFDNIAALVDLGRTISPIFLEEKVLIADVDLWPEISKEEVGKMAASISHISELRDAVFDLQRRQIREPGLVAEGRDMTSAVFPSFVVLHCLRASRNFLSTLSASSPEIMARMFVPVLDTCTSYSV
jgi:cytidylate kinase